jgi:FkbM family methyltransferase
MIPKAVRFIRRHGFLEAVSEALPRLQRQLTKYYYIMRKQRYVRSTFGVLMVSNWDDKTFEFCIYGEPYGRFYSNYLSSYPHEFTMVDVGANQGLYSLIAARNPCCRRVISFEPVHSTYGFLLSNIAVNVGGEKIVPINAALSGMEGSAQIYIKPEHSGAASLHPLGQPSTREEVRTVRVDAIRAHVPPEARMLVKIDTEGHEEVIINELCNNNILSEIDSIFYEVDMRRISACTIERKLRRAGFTNFRQVGKGRHYDVLASRSRLGVFWLTFFLPHWPLFS